MSGGVWYSTFWFLRALDEEEEAVEWLDVEPLLFGLEVEVAVGGWSSSDAETGVRERGELEVEEGSRWFGSEYCDPAEE